MTTYIEELIDKFDSISDIKRYELIKKNNAHVIQLLKDELKDETIINIVAKGPTATYIDNAHAINQGAIFTNKKYVYLNDIHSLFGIEQYIKDMKYVFFPDYPHFNCRSHPNVTYIHVLKYLKKYNFTGYVFIYRLHTSKSNLLNFYATGKIGTSTVLPIIIIRKFCKINIPIHTYGFKNGVGYHKDLNEKVYRNKYEERKKSYLWIASECNLPENVCINVCNKLEKYYKRFNQIKPRSVPINSKGLFLH